MRVQAAVALLAGAAAACPYAALLPPDVSSVVVACPANATLCTVDRACGAIAPCSPLPGVLDLRCSGSPALGDLSATNVSDLSVMGTKLNLEALVLPALASFTVQNCSIERMPSALQWPTSLLTMDLANTSLQSIPAGLPHRLRDLRLDDNDLSRSTTSLDSLPTSLRRL
ncbi:hypothetical protein SPRG_11968 [Saprolegnia parasitica CBS 223.65]|uniref:LRRNT domain-containing protein n=1 Tax=Saprolegnia parasitica (strain CBS 223.65) TaxID=695850 RepID=A0A067BXX4_SAPPC|nr:hypothetical protein SPRG_11968 [Saprolegnia parasitica CBS 223.65]KDO23123.1 hypothetical protein SPRG_11968 [Saprolegnia parasitica CBS 223.65]|eukprot:XP_012206233.1 hypothetical protein SPRG_11968 [Saprolegnia parasitica CBS 223.65]